MLQKLKRVSIAVIVMTLGWSIAWWMHLNEIRRQRIALNNWQGTITAAVDRGFLFGNYESDVHFIDQLGDFANSDQLQDAFERSNCEIAELDKAERAFLILFGPQKFQQGELVELRDPAFETLQLLRIERTRGLIVCDLDNDGWPAVKLPGFEDKVLAANEHLECLVLTQTPIEE